LRAITEEAPKCAARYVADDPSRKTLVENDAGNVTTLLENCERLAFSFYKRNPVTNSFNQFPVATATNEVKVIQVSWRCSRRLVERTSGSAEMVSVAS
jgi:hypothetical protein